MDSNLVVVAFDRDHMLVVDMLLEEVLHKQVGVLRKQVEDSSTTVSSNLEFVVGAFHNNPCVQEEDSHNQVDSDIMQVVIKVDHHPHLLLFFIWH